MDPRDQLLFDRATRALGTAVTVGDAFVRVRAIIGPLNFPQTEAVAEEAMRKLRNGIVPTPAERAALELVVKALRPSVLSRQGMLDDLPQPEKQSQEAKDRWTKFRGLLEPFLYAVGRIDRVAKPADIPLATGFVISDHLLVTNKHVLAALSFETMVLEKGQAVVRFGQESGTVPDLPPVAITGVVAVHPDLDIAVLRIDSVTAPPLPISDRNPAVEEAIAVVR